MYTLILSYHSAIMEVTLVPIRSNIEFKFLLITFKVLKGLAPLYLSELISVLPPSSHIILEGSIMVHYYALLHLNLREP